MNLRGDSMDIVNICTAGLMLSSAALFAGNAVYDYKFGKKTMAAIRQFESGKPSSVIDDVLNQTLLAIAICTGFAFVFEELALHLQGIENVQAQYMVQFSLNVFILVGVQAMTWYLATPFMAYLRYFASRNNYDTKLFPMYGVIYGDSNGGKTTFIKFLVKLMCGETVKMNTTEDFTATRIDGLKRVCEGLPLNIDDLAKTQFQNHSERVIKNDEWGISDRLVNYPAVSITSNKITSLTKDLSKRAIICRIGAKIDNERGAKNSKRVNESMSELTTAFYGEYVRRMLVCIDEMTTEMRENANGKEYFPDIFHASSSVIADIFEACGIDLPDYVRILYYNDYMGDESIGRAAIEKIELAWQADPSKFRVDKKQNRLIYSYPPDGPWYELKYIADELPNSLEAEISGGNQLIMNYEQAQELFGIKFRRWLGIFNL